MARAGTVVRDKFNSLGSYWRGDHWVDSLGANHGPRHFIVIDLTNIRSSSRFAVMRDRLTNVVSLVRIDEFPPYIDRRVTIAFGYNKPVSNLRKFPFLGFSLNQAFLV